MWFSGLYIFRAVVLQWGKCPSIPTPRGHLAVSTDVFGCHNWVG